MITRSDGLWFLSLFGFWLVLTWNLDPLFLAMGVLAAAGTTAAFRPVRYVLSGDGATTRPGREYLIMAIRTAAYAGWLLGRVVVACLQVARIVLHPRLPIDPRCLRFRTGLRSPVARAMLANSITLTPGTVTVELDGEELTVHAMVLGAADDLVSGEMQTRVARVFLEPEQPAPAVTWVTGPEVLP